MRTCFTLDDYVRLPEGYPAQLIDGCLVKEPSPTYEHQQLIGRLHVLLVDRLGAERVVLAPADVVIDRLNVLQPDVCVLGALPDPTSHDVGIPVAVFEVLSPSTRRRDRTVKATKLLAAGVEEVWLVDPAHRTLELRTVRGAVLARGSDEIRSSVLVGVTLVPEPFFRA